MKNSCKKRKLGLKSRSNDTEVSCFKKIYVSHHDLAEAGPSHIFQNSDVTDTKIRSWNRRWALVEKATRLGKSVSVDDLLFGGDYGKFTKPRKKITADENAEPEPLSVFGVSRNCESTTDSQGNGSILCRTVPLTLNAHGKNVNSEIVSTHESDLAGEYEESFVLNGQKDSEYEVNSEKKIVINAKEACKKPRRLAKQNVSRRLSLENSQTFIPINGNEATNDESKELSRSNVEVLSAFSLKTNKINLTSDQTTAVASEITTGCESQKLNLSLPSKSNVNLLLKEHAKSSLSYQGISSQDLDVDLFNVTDSKARSWNRRWVLFEKAARSGMISDMLLGDGKSNGRCKKAKTTENVSPKSQTFLKRKLKSEANNVGSNEKDSRPTCLSKSRVLSPQSESDNYKCKELVHEDTTTKADQNENNVQIADIEKGKARIGKKYKNRSKKLLKKKMKAIPCSVFKFKFVLDTSGRNTNECVPESNASSLPTCDTNEQNIDAGFCESKKDTCSSFSRTSSPQSKEINLRTLSPKTNITYQNNPDITETPTTRRHKLLKSARRGVASKISSNAFLENKENDLNKENCFQFEKLRANSKGNKNGWKLSRKCHEEETRRTAPRLEETNVPKFCEFEKANEDKAKKKFSKLSRTRMKWKLKKKKVLREALHLNSDFQSIRLTPVDGDLNTSQDLNRVTPTRKCKKLKTKSPNIQLGFSPISNSQESNNEIAKEVDNILDTLHASSPGEMKDNTEAQCSAVTPLDSILKDVVACVQVRASWEDRSEAVEDQLKIMGATISYSKKLRKDVTHLVFKDGQRGMYKKALQKSLHIVSVQWIETCKQNRRHMPENLFPVILPETPKFNILEKKKMKRFRSMQPKDLSAECNASVEEVKEIVRRTLKSTRNENPCDKLLAGKFEHTQVVPDILIQCTEKEKCIGSNEKKEIKDSKKELVTSHASTLSKTPPVDDLLILPLEKRKLFDSLETQPTNSLVLTSVSVSDQEAAYSITAALGGFRICNTVGNSTTHVVCGDKRRTLNLLMALVRGCWILSPQWIFDSLESGKWLDEEPYEVVDFFPAVKASRMKRAKQGPIYRQNLFGEVGKMYLSPLTKPPPDKLQELIEMAGGKVVTSVRHSEVFVGQDSGKGPLTKSLYHISEQQILDCITQNQVLKITKEKHTLQF